MLRELKMDYSIEAIIQEEDAHGLLLSEAYVEMVFVKQKGRDKIEFSIPADMVKQAMCLVKEAERKLNDGK